MDYNTTVNTLGHSQPLVSSWLTYVWESGWATAICSIVALSLTTRIFSGPLSQQPPIEDGVRTVPLAPYWFPVLGHIIDLSLNAKKFFAWARNTYKGGAFALNFGGTTHNFIFHPSLGTALLNNRNGAADSDYVFKHIMCATFGFPRAELNKYDAAMADLEACYKHLLSEPSLGTMVGKTVVALKENISNLVTFSSSWVDQNKWERTTGVDVREINGEQVVETSLLPLIRDFVAFTANPALVGTDFINNFPDFFSDLWIMDRGFFYLSTGLPRWFPFPPLTTAHLARRRMFSAISQFEVALDKERNGQDPGSEWHSLDDVSALVAARVDIYRKYDMSTEARSSFEATLLWAMNANANPLLFWMLNHIYADKAVLERLRNEIAPYAQAVQPKQEFPFPEAPRLQSLDQEGLTSNCPLLESCYFETLRVDTSIYSFKVMKEDLVLSGRDKTADSYLLKKGTYTHVAHDMHHKDPAAFEDPETWRADRHITYATSKDGEEWVSVSMGTIRPFGGGHSMCKGRAFAQKEILIFVAAIISLWDIEPAEGGSWKMPKQKKATGTYTTTDDTKVWIKRRALPETKL